MTMSMSMSTSASESNSRSQSKSHSASGTETMSSSESQTRSHTKSASSIFQPRVLGGVVGQVLFSVGIFIFVCCTGCFLLIFMIPRYRRRRNE
jgi:hypothetical protein